MLSLRIEKGMASKPNYFRSLREGLGYLCLCIRKEVKVGLVLNY